MTRKLSPYEKTHLHRFGKADVNIDDYGEMPVEYITGQVEFGGQIFTINKDVLIPRVETEEFVNLALEKIAKNKNQELVIADVGCGSGAIGISVWKHLPPQKAKLYLSDISKAAIAVTKININQLIDEKKNMQLLQSDLLESYPEGIKFDLIMANLPYIPSARVAILEDSVKEYEPHLALDGGEDGLKYIKKMVKQAQDKLNPGGVILMEVDYTHDETYLNKKLNLGNMTLKTKRDQFERMRFAVITN